MIRFPCHCNFVFELPEDQAGSLVQCPKCGRLNDVPTLSDLASITEEGTYKLDTPSDDPAEINRLAELQRAFAKQKIDDWGREIDLRPTMEDIARSGADEIPLDLKDEVRPGAPKYDPITGELIRPMNVKADADAAPAGPVPIAARAIHYASAGTQTIGGAGIFLEMFTGPNLFVMFCIFATHLFLQVLLIPAAFFCLAIPLYLTIAALIIGHYANTIDETGPEGRDELPRPLRHMQWTEDLFGSFVRMSLALLICFAPAGAMMFVRGVPLAGRGAAALIFAGLGMIAFPAVVLTTTTSGTVLNLRPDRVLGVMRRMGPSYVTAVLFWCLAAGVYVAGFIGTNVTLVQAFEKSPPKWMEIAFHPAITYPLLLAGIYLMHAFCWYMGLQYRWHHAGLPWVLQRYTSRRDDYGNRLPPPPAPAQGFMVQPSPRPAIPPNDPKAQRRARMQEQ